MSDLKSKMSIDVTKRQVTPFSTINLSKPKPPKKDLKIQRKQGQIEEIRHRKRGANLASISLLVNNINFETIKSNFQIKISKQFL